MRNTRIFPFYLSSAGEKQAAQKLGFESHLKTRRDVLRQFLDSSVEEKGFKTINAKNARRELFKHVTVADALLNPASLNYGVTTAARLKISGANEKLIAALWIARLKDSLTVLRQRPKSFAGAMREIFRARTWLAVANTASTYRVNALNDAILRKSGVNWKEVNLPLQQMIIRSKVKSGKPLSLQEKVLAFSQVLSDHAYNPGFIGTLEALMKKRRFKTFKQLAR